MIKLFFITLLTYLAISANAFGQTVPKTSKSPSEFVPSGYVVVETIQGDLNADGVADYVYVIKGTHKSKFVKDEYRGVLDRNRRGILVALSDQGEYKLAVNNRKCFSSENEDGGVYYAPELNVGVAKGTLGISYMHGRYGYWAYTFRYQNGEFELIGYDSSDNRGPVVESTVSINFQTKKMRLQKNINADSDGEDEKFKTTWKKLTFSKPILLSKVSDFDELSMKSALKQFN